MVTTIVNATKGVHPGKHFHVKMVRTASRQRTLVKSKEYEIRKQPVTGLT